jgi:hypothetical protein
MAQAAEMIGVAAVTVHGRTKAQGFSGRADWSMIKAVKESVGIPVIGNGDVRSAQDAKRILDETACDGVMIGRAIQGYPWIFREAKHYLETGIMPPHPSLQERESIMLRHLNDMVDLLGENIGIREMRKHLCWYTKGLSGGAEFRERVNRLSRVNGVKREVKEYFLEMTTGAVVRHHRDERCVSRGYRHREQSFHILFWYPKASFWNPKVLQKIMAIMATPMANTPSRIDRILMTPPLTRGEAAITNPPMPKGIEISPASTPKNVYPLNVRK